MKTTRRILLLLALPLAGCRHLQTSQRSGSELATDANGHSTAVTYVTPEEYDRMTPAERERLHARVGVQVTVPLWGRSNAKPRDLTEEEVKRAQGN